LQASVTVCTIAELEKVKVQNTSCG